VNWIVTSVPGISGAEVLNATPRSLMFTVLPKTSDSPFLIAAAATEMG
jgi:hypothetical protein